MMFKKHRHLLPGLQKKRAVAQDNIVRWAGWSRRARSCFYYYADIGFDSISTLCQHRQKLRTSCWERCSCSRSQSGCGHKHCPQVINELKIGREDSVIAESYSSQDYHFLYDSGVAAIFGPNFRIKRLNRYLRFYWRSIIIYTYYVELHLKDILLVIRMKHSFCNHQFASKEFTHK